MPRLQSPLPPLLAPSEHPPKMDQLVPSRQLKHAPPEPWSKRLSVPRLQSSLPPLLAPSEHPPKTDQLVPSRQLKHAPPEP